MLTSNPEKFMKLALEEAAKAQSLGEVPIGAVIVKNSKVISKNFNTIEKDKDPTAHAEIKVIREAGNLNQNWRLEGFSLFVNVEPCTMCMGAIRQARLSELYFGCYDEKFGAAGSLYNLAEDKKLKVYPEILHDESVNLMHNFFENLRRNLHK